METEKIRIKGLFTIILLILAVELVMGFWASRNPSHRLAVLGIARIIETAGIILSVVHMGNGLNAIGLYMSGIRVGIIRGAVWSFGFGLIALLAGLLLFLIGMEPLHLIASGLPEKLNERVMIFLVGGIIGPVAEEVFFRGVCYTFFRRWGVIIAIILTTVVFVSAHFVQSIVPVPQIVGGILFAVAYECEKNLMVPIIIHITGNLSIFFLSLLN